MKEGLAPSPWGQTWFKVYGKRTDDLRIPLVVVHGGPGLTHDYLRDLSQLAQDREVIFYDQIGNGRSSPVGQLAADTITLQSLVDELENLLRFLGLDETGYVLLGHSSGGCVALEHVLRQPRKIAGLILADAFPSGELMQRGMRTWLAELRLGLQQPPIEPDRHDPSREAITGSELGAFFARHVCRVPPPEHLLHSLAAAEQFPQVQHKLMGKNLFDWNGELAKWSVTSRLAEVMVPVLAYGGAWDEASPNCLEVLGRNLPDCRTITFTQSSHLPHIEQTDKCLAAIEEFLNDL